MEELKQEFLNPYIENKFVKKNFKNLGFSITNIGDNWNSFKKQVYRSDTPIILKNKNINMKELQSFVSRKINKTLSLNFYYDKNDFHLLFYFNENIFCIDIIFLIKMHSCTLI